MADHEGEGCDHDDPQENGMDRESDVPDAECARRDAEEGNNYLEHLSPLMRLLPGRRSVTLARNAR